MIASYKGICAGLNRIQHILLADWCNYFKCWSFFQTARKYKTSVLLTR